MARAFTFIQECSNSPWLERLQGSFVRCGIGPVEMVPDDDFDVSCYDSSCGVPAWEAESLIEPKTFEDILGLDKVVESLTARVTARSETLLLFHGPDGVGKRTVARLYAKAILCESPAPTGSPCHRCEMCRKRLEDLSLNFLEVDGAMAYGSRGRGTASIAKYVRENFDGLRPSGPSVVIINNADEFETSALDVLLKSFEDKRREIIFILTARVAKNVRPAVLSRFVALKFRKADQRALKTYLEDRCQAAGLPYEDRALEVICAVAECKPGKLHRALEEVARAGRITLESTRVVHNLGWVAPMILYWQDVLADKDTSIPLSESIGNEELAKRVRLFLNYLCLIQAGMMKAASALDPAFIYQDEGMFDRLNEIWRARAKSQDASGDVPWLDLSRIWVASDNAAFAAAELSTRCYLADLARG